MRLGAERAKRHARRGEPAADVLDGLDFLQRDPLGGGYEFEQIAQGDGRRVERRVDVFLVVLRRVGLDEGVEILDHRRSDRVRLAVGAEAVHAGVTQSRWFTLAIGARHGVGQRVPPQAFLRDLAEADAFDLRRRAGETFRVR